MDYIAEYYTEFAEWLDKHLSRTLSANIAAYNFNLYVGVETPPTYHLELIGAPRFDEYDANWACREIFDTREDFFCLPQSGDGEKDTLDEDIDGIMAIINRYLKVGKYALKLTMTQAVGVGHVSGPIYFLHRSGDCWNDDDDEE